MFVSYNWLKEYVDINGVSAEELADLITKSGIEVEAVEHLNKGISGVVVGHVLECEQHPNADKLRVCKVDIGEEEPVQIVCGAANVGANQTVAVAKVGAVLPGNFKIKKAKLRGEASHGMICSLQELGIEGKLISKAYSEGIFVFPTNVDPGTDAMEYLNLNDQVLELGLTPNRADCLSMIGVAYEVAAILNKEVSLPKSELSTNDEKTSDFISVAVEAKDENPYYGARIVKDVKIGPSPLWLQNRLMAAGIRPISNVVDITNYILIEYGQPLHAFDYDRIGSKEIVVRLAKQDEEIVTLDDEKRKLNSHHLVITNGNEPIAVAGVMGGAFSEVQDDTKTVLIEAAYFKGLSVRQASKDLGLRSEASSRFEKGIDPQRVKLACDRAAQLMAELAGGVILEGVVETGELEQVLPTVTVSVEKINQSLGTSLTEENVSTIFSRLQFDYNVTNGIFDVVVPSRRWDITIQEDLIEEVARMYGYDEIPTTLPIGETTPGALTEHQAKRRKVRRFLEGASLYQAKTYSLTSVEKSLQYAMQSDLNPVTLKMPMSEERSRLRTSLIPHLLEVIQYNQSRQIDDVAIYELGPVFLTSQQQLTELPEEKERLAGALSGVWQENKWQGEKKVVDFYVAKGIVEGLFTTLGIEEERIVYKQDTKDGLHPGRTASIFIDEIFVGHIGQIHPEQQKAYDIQETYVFELDADVLFNLNISALAYEKLPRFPSMTRDIALVVDETVQAGQLKETIITAGGKLLKDVHLFDVYQGEHLEKGKKSLAFSLRYYNDERTLTEEEVTKAHQVVLDSLEQNIGATLRG